MIKVQKAFPNSLGIKRKFAEVVIFEIAFLTTLFCSISGRTCRGKGLGGHFVEAEQRNKVIGREETNEGLLEGFHCY
jgi:hypothetical protein